MTIEQQLKALKTSLNPTSDVTEGIRNTLTKRAHFLSSISHVQSVPLSMRLGVWQTYRFTFAHIRQVASVAFIILLSSGGTFMAKASLAAVSGDTLYPIKRNLLEKVELVLAPTAQDEANVYLKHVATRLDEIRVLNSRDIPAEEKTQHINQTVLALNRDLTSARQSLQIAAKDSTKDANTTAAVVAVAKGMTQSTSDVKAALSTTKNIDKSGQAELNQSVTEAIISADEASADSLDILLNSYAKDSQQVNKDELAKLVEQELVTVGDRINVVERSAIASGGQELRWKVRQTLYTQLNEHLPSPFDMPTYDGLRSDMDKAHKQLDEANSYLKFSDFTNAVSWAHQAKDTAETVAKTLNQASTLTGVALLPESVVSTSTAPTATTTSSIPTTTAAVRTVKNPVVQPDELVESTVSSF
jgi:hypothetical protein